MKNNRIFYLIRAAFLFGLIAAVVLLLKPRPSLAASAPIDISGVINVPGNPYGALRYVGSPAPAGYSSAFVTGDPGIICQPDNEITEFDGTIDISDMDNGDVALFGLLDKGLMATGNKGYMSGAYLYVLKSNASTVRIAPSDGNAGGEIYQVSFNLPIPVDGIIPINIKIDGQADPASCANNGSGTPGVNDVGCITVTSGSNSIKDSYGTVKTLNNSGAYLHDEFSQGAYPGWDDYLNSKIKYDMELNGCEAMPPVVKFNAPGNLVCTGDVVMSIDFSRVANLYGYEFKVSYDATKVDATGAFDNGWFDTANNAFPVWPGTCSAGSCAFAVSKTNPATPVSGSGTVAKITFSPKSPVAPGTFTAGISDLILTDIDGFALTPVDTSGATFNFNTCGQATVSGTVSLQGRTTPMDAGKVTFHDNGGNFVDSDVAFDASTGAFNATLYVMPGGSNYTMRAHHYLYLGNEKNPLALSPGGAVSGQNTRLLGGDANNSGRPANIFSDPGVIPGVDSADLSCIGTDFGGPVGNCGDPTNGRTDINKDNLVNVQDLSIAGGNYNKNPFLGW